VARTLDMSPASLVELRDTLTAVIRATEVAGSPAPR